MDRGITKEDAQYIESIIQMVGDDICTKKILIPLKKIKERVTGTIDRECFCSSIRRRIWYKDFINWYEANS
jgi:hypothetical protein